MKSETKCEYFQVGARMKASESDSGRKSVCVCA